MTVIGVIGARIESDKRGVAANLAAFAASRERAGSVIVIDADPADGDVGMRLGVTGPDVERVCSLSDGVSGGALLAVAGRVAWPPMRVVPASPGPALDAARAAGLRSVLARLRVAADLVVVDCPVATAPLQRDPATTILGAVDVLVVAVTPDRTSVAAARKLVDSLPHAAERGWVAPNVVVRIAVTGDEGSSALDPAETAADLADLTTVGTVAGTAVVPQWWGRTPPNFGFGPTLQIPEIDRGLAALLGVPVPESMDHWSHTVIKF